MANNYILTYCVKRIMSHFLKIKYNLRHNLFTISHSKLMPKLVRYFWNKTVSRRQTVWKFGILYHLATKEQSSDYMDYKNIISIFPRLEIRKFFLHKLMSMKMQRSNDYHIKEKLWFRRRNTYHAT